MNRMILKGNMFMIICCIFYLAWWILAFRPEHPVKGLRSGWLLIPAALCGIYGVYILAQGFALASSVLIPIHILVIAGIAAYLLLLLVTGFFFHRMVTTELVLIVGWSILMLAEISVMAGAGVMGKTMSVLFMVGAVLIGVVSLICYMLYYNLGKTAGFWDGMLPLAFTAIFMAIVSVTIIVKL